MEITGVIHTEIKLDLKPFGNFKFSWARQKVNKPNVIMIGELTYGERYDIGAEAHAALIKAMKAEKTEVFANKVWSKYYCYTTVESPFIREIDNINLRKLATELSLKSL